MVCSRNRESIQSHQEKLGAEYPIAETLDPVKRFNFYTSTAFEGCDIYDEKGRIFIINDGNVPHTLIDIRTLFAQIAGRLRDSCYKGHIVHIYSTTRRTSDVTLEEFISAKEAEYQRSVQFVERINKNNNPDDIGELHTKKRYVRTTNEGMAIDRNLLNSDIVTYKLRNDIYHSKVNIANELLRNGYKILDETALITTPILLEANPRISFQELFVRYCELKENELPYQIGMLSREIALIEKNKPLIKHAYSKLGPAEVERLNYNQTNIKRELSKRLDISLTAKIITLINSEIPHQKAVPNSEVKKILQDIYNELDLNRRAKATDLSQWYTVKQTTPKIDDKSTACTTIVCDKIIIRQEAEQLRLFDSEDDI